MKAIDILKENGIQMLKEDGIWRLKKDKKTIIRPEHPKQCYKLLIDEFNIVEPHFLNFK